MTPLPNVLQSAAKLDIIGNASTFEARRG